MTRPGRRSGVLGGHRHIPGEFHRSIGEARKPIGAPHGKAILSGRMPPG
jgi:hypothetical protein